MEQGQNERPSLLENENSKSSDSHLQSEQNKLFASTNREQCMLRVFEEK
jgi:hypothetical protein